MKRLFPRVLPLLLALGCTAWATAADADTPPILQVQADADVMPFADVRVGMKGYGLSVFHGSTIEPFAVEVISVVSDSSPKRGTVWMRCTDERMQKSGPVQGMSGSPIFLWNEGETGTIGEGGRLVGAFAFGYRASKDCIVGVQPIELMRDIATRKDRPATARRGSWERSRATLARLMQLAETRQSPASWTWRAAMLRHAIGAADVTPTTTTPAEPSTQQPQPLLLPLSVGPAQIADAVRPLFEPMGLSPVAGETLAGPPPVGIDPEAVQIAPGSVLAVPLVFGDMELAATGTVTDVLADGTVLGFGHAMFSEGGTALPMATGYVHFVLPSMDISFKRAASLRMAGSLVRDEESGVLGATGQRFTTSPIRVDVEHVDGSAESFEYQMVNYRALAPQIAATVVLRSIAARHSVPLECTIDMDAALTFEGGRSFEFASTLAGADVTAPLFELLPILTLMTENPFQSLELESLRVRVKVRPGVDAASIVRASIDHAEVAPGGTVRVTLELQPQDAERITLTGEITIPRDTPEGEYPLVIGGGSTYTAMLNRTWPHRSTVNSIDDLAALIREAYAVPNEGLYLMLPRDQGGVAVGRTELPRVPSSRAALLTSPTHSFATTFGRLTTTRIDTPLTLLGQATFQISVRKGAFGAQAAATPDE